MARGYLGLIDLLLCVWCFSAVTSANRGRGYRAGYNDGARFGENADEGGGELPAIIIAPGGQESEIERA